MNCKFEKAVRKSKKWSDESVEIYQESQDLEPNLSDQLKKVFASFFIVGEEEQVTVLQESEKIIKIIATAERKLIQEFGQLRRE